MAGNVISIDDVKKALKLKYGHVVYPDGARKIKEGHAIMFNPPPRTLPEGYTPVEYIESSGTQYIDVGFVPTQNTRVVIDFTYLAGTYGTPFGAYVANATTVYCVHAVPDSGWKVYYNTNGTVTSVSSTIGQRYLMDFNKNVMTINGELAYTGAETTFTADCSLTLFGAHKTTTVTELISSRLYSCQIYDNDVLVRDYIPCTNADGTVGLYDAVTSVFYTNAGSGVFTSGDKYGKIARKIFEGQKPGSITLSASTVYTDSAKSGSVTATILGDGVITAVSSNTSKATVSVSGNTITIKAAGTGTATVTVIVGETDEYTEASANLTVRSNTIFAGYSGTYTRANALYSVSGKSCMLYTLTKTGTLTLNGSANAWLCGGGYSGYSSSGTRNGGAGGFVNSGTITSGSHAVTVAAGNGSSKIGSALTANGANVDDGGSGGGSEGNSGAGTGAGVSTYPFGISSLKAHCAGGAGGAVSTGAINNKYYGYHGGDGGSNGSDGGKCSTAGSSASPVSTISGGTGGTYGGGNGGGVSGTSGSGSNQNGKNATFYGSGGGCAARGTIFNGASKVTISATGGSGYQGVVYIAVPLS